MSERRHLRRALGTLAVLGTLAAATAGVAWSAFFSTATNGGNTFAAGTVSIEDNDAGSAMLALTSAGPADSDTSCVEVTYTGSLASTVRLYASVTGSLAPYLTLTVTRGTDAAAAFDSCGAFTADATNYVGAGPGVVYSGPLSSLPTSYDTAIVDPTTASPESWTTSEAHSYRFVVSLASDTAAQGLSAAATLTWEARNS